MELKTVSVLLLLTFVVWDAESFATKPTLSQCRTQMDRTICGASVASVNQAPGATSNDPENDPARGKEDFASKAKRMLEKNPALADIGFLRKRTSRILHLTSEGYNRENSFLGKGSVMAVGRKAFNWLISGWCFTNELDSPDQAVALLERMEELYRTSSRPDLFRPDTRSYTRVINTIARASRPNAGEVAEGIMKRMEEEFYSGRNKAAKPNTHTYTAVLEAYAYSDAPGAAANAHRICEDMAKRWDEGDDDVAPTSRCFNAVFNAWAKSGDQWSAYRAEALFDRQRQLYRAGNYAGKPNSVNFNCLVAAWANSDDEEAAPRAEHVLMRMEAECIVGDDTKPTTLTYNSVIDAWAKSGAPNAAERAEKLLRYMEEVYESGENLGAKPNTRSFNSVMNVWAKSARDDAAYQAENLMGLMERLHAEGNDDVQPDVHSYCTVISAWGRSNIPGKASRAYSLLREMITLHEAGNERLRPNVVAFNAVMNACAYTNGDDQECNRAVEIAHATMVTLEKSDYGHPDQVTYGTFLAVLGNQMPECDTQRRAAAALFKKCCRDGQVGHLVLRELRSAVTMELFELLVRMREEDFEPEKIPFEWRRNVVEGRWKRKRMHGLGKRTWGSR